jgi:hypothetical protein
MKALHKLSDRSKTGINSVASPSPRSVTLITVLPVSQIENIGRGASMPILMIALFALAVFGLIGFLLAAAVILETRKARTENAPVRASTPANKPAA